MWSVSVPSGGQLPVRITVYLYAHSWSERSEWICPVCSMHDKIECDQKWEHILQYNRVGIYRVLDGRTVAEFLDNFTIPYVLSVYNDNYNSTMKAQLLYKCVGTQPRDHDGACSLIRQH